MFRRPIRPLTGVAACCLLAAACSDQDATAPPEAASVAFAQNQVSITEGGRGHVALALTTPAPLARQRTATLEIRSGSAGGADFGVEELQLVFPAGSENGAVVSLPMTALDDELVEGTEDLQIGLAGADAVLPVHIEDDEAPALVQIANQALRVSEGGAFGVTLTLDMQGEALGQPIDVFLADLDGDTTVGEDHPATKAMVRFASGSERGATAVASVQVTPDLRVEDDETFALMLMPHDGPGVVEDVPVKVVIEDDDRLVGTAMSGFVSAFDIHSPLRESSGLGLDGNTEPVASAYHPLKSRFYVVANGRADMLTIVDPTTGAITEVGPLGASAVRGMTYDVMRGELYAVDSGSNTLMTIDADSGTATPAGQVGALGFGGVESIAYVPGEDALFAIDDDTDQLLRVDGDDGTAEAIAELRAGVYTSLSYDVQAGRLATVDNGDVPALVHISTDGEAYDLVGVLGEMREISSLSFVGAKLVFIDEELDALFGRDSNNAEIQFLGALGADRIDALADGILPGEIYGIARGSAALLAIDSERGTFVSLARLSDPSVRATAAALDSAAEVLSLVDEAENRLVEVDPDNGQVSHVGPLSAELRGLAYAGVTLYGVSERDLYVVDPLTAELTLVGPTGLEEMEGLDFDEASGELFALADTGRLLAVVDPSSGESSPIGATGAAAPAGEPGLTALASEPARGLIAADSRRGVLATLSSSSGLLRTIGGFGIDADALAYHPAHDVMYASELSSEWLFAIDPLSHEAQAIGSLGAPVQALAVDGEGALIGVSLADVVSIAPGTAEVTIVGKASHAITGLAHNPNDDVLYGASSSELVTVDTESGATNAVGPFGTDFTSVQALAFDPRRNALYASDVADQQLLSVDPGTGAADALRATTGRAVLGMTFLR